MSAVAIRDLDLAFSHLPLDTTNDRASNARTRNDAQIGIEEIDALRDVDMVAPPEAAELAEPLVEIFRGNVTSGDHLRLPQMTQLDGPKLRSAVGRVLATDTASVSGSNSRDAVLKEAKMRRVLRALDTVVSNIQHQASMNVRD